ncbi:MAG: adenylate/guanylate cyclase domain-containing protein [Aggregatilineales bacterium]
MEQDHTNKIPTPSSGADEQTSRTQEQMRLIGQRTSDLIQLLTSQRDMLQKRGMNLPSGSLDSLTTLKRRVEGLSRQLLSEQLELRRLRGLAETTALVNSSLEVNDVLNQIMDTVINLTGAERGYIVLMNRQTGEFEFAVARGIDREQLVNSVDTSGRKGEMIVSKTVVNQVAERGEPILTDNASEDTRFQGQQSVVGYALRSILAVPLKVRGEVIGVVYCDNRILSGLFQKSELDLVTSFTTQTAVAIENARLFESMRDQLWQLTEIRDLLANVFDSISSGVITISQNGTIITANAASEVMLARQGLMGHTLEDVLPRMEEDFFEVLTQVFEDGEQRLVEVNPLVNGEAMIWNVIISALRNAAGERQGLALVLDDMTEQKAREATLAEVRRYLPPALVENIRSLDDVSVIGQEREISSISTDVRGFTTFSEKLEPEELMKIINQYLSVASDAINLYEGIVDKYMGDAVTGLYNTQLNPQEDHAVRAVRAAWSVIYDLYALHEVLPEDQRLFYGIGIHTGPAFLGNVGSEERKEFTAIGEATTISKILESNAGPGEIIISPSTYERVKDLFECEERVPEKTKGENIPLVYKVLKRKKGMNTGALFLDPELADLLKDLGD